MADKETSSVDLNMHSVVDRIFAEDSATYSADPVKLMVKVKQRCACWLEGCKSLNATGGSAGHGELVHMRCMIQDVKGPEMFVSSCSSSDEKILCGVLRDSLDCTEIKEVLATATRYSYTVVPVPGATEWFIEKSHGEQTAINNGDDSLVSEPQEKRSRTEKKGGLNLAGCEDMDFKIKAKFFDDAAEDLLPNHVFDVYGIMDVNALCVDDEPFTDDIASGSSFPRLHVIHYEEVDHHQLVSRSCPHILPSDPFAAINRVRESFCSLFGDQLTADFIICNLISTTYSRPDGFPICSMPLNLVNVTESASIIRLIKLLVPKVQILEISVQTLGEKPFLPSMDHEKDMLNQGVLQLSDGTLLILDETKLHDGPLRFTEAEAEVANKNLRALKQLVTSQKMEYDYVYYQLPMECDVIVLILSKKPSVLGLDAPFVVAVPPQFNDGIDPAVELSKSGGELLDASRHALLVSRNAVKNVTIGEETNKKITDDFVETRRRSSNIDAGAQLHRLLTLSRLLTAAEGKDAVDLMCWNKAKAMEGEREEVLAKFSRTRR